MRLCAARAIVGGAPLQPAQDGDVSQTAGCLSGHAPHGGEHRREAEAGSARWAWHFHRLCPSRCAASIGSLAGIPSCPGAASAPSPPPASARIRCRSFFLLAGPVDQSSCPPLGTGPQSLAPHFLVRCRIIFTLVSPPPLAPR